VGLRPPHADTVGICVKSQLQPQPNWVAYQKNYSGDEFGWD